MSKDERRRQDPIWWQQVRARLARIKVAQAAKRMEALGRDVRQPNVLEATMLRARLEGGEDRGHDQCRR